LYLGQVYAPPVIVSLFLFIIFFLLPKKKCLCSIISRLQCQYIINDFFLITLLPFIIVLFLFS